jgi:hypothetical protein
MAGGYYHADTEDGGHWVDPSEDLLFMLIDELCHPTNTFVVIEPEDEPMNWFASVSLVRCPTTAPTRWNGATRPAATTNSQSRRTADTSPKNSPSGSPGAASQASRPAPTTSSKTRPRCPRLPSRVHRALSEFDLRHGAVVERQYSGFPLAECEGCRAQ